MLHYWDVLLFGLNLLLVLNLFHLFLLSSSLLYDFNSSIKQISDSSQPSDHILHLIEPIINLSDFSNLIILLLILRHVSTRLLSLFLSLFHDDSITHSSRARSILLSLFHPLVESVMNRLESSQFQLFALPLLSLSSLLELPLS